MQYFAKRHKQGEKLHLPELDVGKSHQQNAADIGYVATRRADDLEPASGGHERVVFGKGTINCEKQRIYIWNMETMEPAVSVEQSISGSPCKEPSDWKPGESVIACARRA